MLSIRTTFTQAEVPALYEIEKQSFTPMFRWDRATFESEITKADVWIGEEEGKIVGFLVGKYYASRKQGYIMSVEVDPQHRGKGYGKDLCLACEADYKERGAETMKLEVYVDNPAQVLYFKLGYRVAGFKKDFYQADHHGLKMVKVFR